MIGSIDRLLFLCDKITHSSNRKVDDVIHAAGVHSVDRCIVLCERHHLVRRGSTSSDSARAMMNLAASREAQMLSSNSTGIRPRKTYVEGAPG